MNPTAVFSETGNSPSPRVSRRDTGISIKVDHVDEAVDGGVLSTDLDPPLGEPYDKSPSPQRTTGKKHNSSRDPNTGSNISERRSRSRIPQRHYNSRGYLVDYYGSMRYRNPEHIVASLEYEQELIRRQQQMIAVQPKTGLEEIEEKRQLLRLKVEMRKKAASRSTSRGRGGTKQMEHNRSPSPYNLKDQLVVEKHKSSRTGHVREMRQARTAREYHIGIKPAETKSQVMRVTKKIQ